MLCHALRAVRAEGTQLLSEVFTCSALMAQDVADSRLYMDMVRTLGMVPSFGRLSFHHI
jgi:hypothetical protein